MHLLTTFASGTIGAAMNAMAMPNGPIYGVSNDADVTAALFIGVNSAASLDSGDLNSSRSVNNTNSIPLDLVVLGTFETADAFSGMPFFMNNNLGVVADSPLVLVFILLS